jgi:triacylglycerol lipase
MAGTSDLVSALDQSQAERSRPENMRLTFKLVKPIQDMTWIQRSLLFAELSRLSYAAPSFVEKAAYEADLDSCIFVERDGAESYVLSNRYDCVIVCRGTEPKQWNDIKADANAWTIASDVGRVHSGFDAEVRDLWPRLESLIKENQRPTWFAGHSLGGAMATICAVRCKLAPIPTDPRAIFTYGAPRVGDRRYSTFLKIKHYRWVNNNDIVPRVPPRWLGYRHMGQEIYLNRRGKISNLRSWLRVRDRFRGLLSSLRVWKLDYLSDHSMVEYLSYIRAMYEEEQSGKPIKKPRHIPAS